MQFNLFQQLATGGAGIWVIGALSVLMITVAIERFHRFRMSAIVPPDRRADSVYYAYTELRLDEDRDVWIAIAADDDSKMWLDERLVWISSPGDKPWYHPPYYLRDELVGSLALTEGQRRVHLSAGVHRLLFKLYNKDDRTFFSVVLSK